MQDELCKIKVLKKKKLFSQFEHIEKFPISLLIASSGSGKTTAVREFYRERRQDVIEISFSEKENQEYEIWNQVCEQLNKKQCHQNGDKTDLPGTKEQGMEFVKPIRNGFDSSTILILDNYQHCRNHAVDQVIQEIVEAEISNLHICIISQYYPDLPYAEWAIKGRCQTIEQPYFDFSREEIDALYHLNMVELGTEELNTIQNFTQGWASAVYLLLLDMAHHGTIIQLQKVVHLMKHSILERMPTHHKEILYRLAPLDEFTIEQAKFILECSYGESDLWDMIEKEGFIHYDAKTKNFRLHNLLRITVINDLKMQPRMEERIWCRNAEWMERQKWYPDAIREYGKAKAREPVFKILKKKGSVKFYLENPEITGVFYDSVNIAEKVSHFSIYGIYLYYLIFFKPGKKTSQYLQEMEAYCMENQNALTLQCLSEVKILQSLNAFPNLSKMTEYAKQAYELRQERKSEVLDKRSLLIYAAPQYLSIYYAISGTLKQTAMEVDSFMSVYTALTGEASKAFTYQIKAEYEFLTGNVREAKRLVDTALERAIFQKNHVASTTMAFLKMRCCICLGLREELEQTLERIEKFTEGVSDELGLIKINKEITNGFIYACIGAEDKVAPWLLNYNMSYLGKVYTRIQSGTIIYGKVLLAKKMYMETDALMESFMSEKKEFRIQIDWLYGKIYQSIAAKHLYGMAEAVSLMKEAIYEVGVDQVTAPFMENASDIIEILEQMEKTSFISKVLACCLEYKKGLDQICNDKQSETRCRLTKREEEILELVKKGYKNLEIAEELYIAKVTVEKALTLMYKKLGVKNRMQLLYHIENQNEKGEGTA